MKKIFVLSLLLVASTLISCADRIDSETPANKVSQAKQSEVKTDCTDIHWRYTGEEGPENWKELCEGFSTCGGQRQSPIDIVTADATPGGDLPPLKISYGSVTATIVNNGHTVRVTPSGGNFVMIGAKKYKLVQFHFHAKSEHTLDGKHFPVEAHFVHKFSDSDFAVISVMVEAGEAKRGLKEYIAKHPEVKGDGVMGEPFDLRKLIPKQLSYYHYKGSLTTPPCSELVNWYVLKTPTTASTQQIEEFSSILKNNFRPVTPLNGRKVLSYSK